MHINPRHSDETESSQFSCSSLIYLIFITLTVIVLMAACTSTASDLPDSPDPITESNSLTVHLSAPDAYTFPDNTTRAGDHDGYYLRYIATLYTYSATVGSVSIDNDATADGKGNRVKRQELLDVDATGPDKRIVFSNVPAGDYFIVVLADYIPGADAGGKPQRGDDGLYPDYFYDTKTSATEISLTSKASGAQFFNNHNLDLFIDKTPQKFKKEENKGYQFNSTLKRAVSRVEVHTTGTGAMNALKDITIKACNVMDNTVTLASSAATHTKSVAGLPVTIPAADPSSRLLFFYYTLSTTTGNVLNATGKMTGATDFTLNANTEQGYKFSQSERTVPGGRISPVANTIYKVQGNFLETSAVPSTALDIDITTDSKWGNEHNPEQSF